MTFPNNPEVPENSIRKTLPIKVSPERLGSVLDKLLCNPNVVEVHVWRSGGLIEVVVDYALMTLATQLAGIHNELTNICRGKAAVVHGS